MLCLWHMITTSHGHRKQGMAFRKDFANAVSVFFLAKNLFILRWWSPESADLKVLRLGEENAFFRSSQGTFAFLTIFRVVCFLHWNILQPGTVFNEYRSLLTLRLESSYFASSASQRRRLLHQTGRTRRLFQHLLSAYSAISVGTHSRKRTQCRQKPPPKPKQQVSDRRMGWFSVT